MDMQTHPQHPRVRGPYCEIHLMLPILYAQTFGMGPHFFFRRTTSANAFGGVIDQEGPPGPGLCFRQSQWSARSEQMTGIVMVHEAAEAAVYPFGGSDFPRPESSVGHHSNKFPFSFPNVDTVFSLATGPLKLKFRIPNQRRYRIGFLEFPLKVK